ncbi:hypothetical protein BKA69DRAFT_1075182 [Paraphysoderma sedebokerense]|nr:hypothetical protein BKA69DRAFT_1075182 [Paraphysoderma sedebokerense]
MTQGTLNNAMVDKPENLWVQFGGGQAFKIPVTAVEDVADLLEAVKEKLRLAKRLDLLQLEVMDAEGLQRRRQRPGKLLCTLLEENPWAGRDDEHPLLVRTTDQRPIEPAAWFRSFFDGWTSEYFVRIKSILYAEWRNINGFTITILLLHLAASQPFSPISATTFFIVLQVLMYLVLYDNQSLKLHHFTTSTENLSQSRYWTVISSSFAHTDINHLLCNIAALALKGPLLECLLGFSKTVMFFCLASAASSLVSLKVNGRPYIGSSGVVFAIEGFISRMLSVEFIGYIVSKFLYYLATKGAELDYVANVGGFVFGYISHDVWQSMSHVNNTWLIRRCTT